MGSARVRHALRRFLRGSRAAYRGDLGVRWAALSGKILLALHGQDTRAVWQFGFGKIKPVPYFVGGLVKIGAPVKATYNTGNAFPGIGIQFG